MFVERIVVAFLYFFRIVIHKSYLNQTKDNKPPENWPYEGAVEFINLSLKYTPEGLSVLHKLNLNIAPQEKVSITKTSIY